VAAGDAGDDGGVDDAQALEPADAQLLVDDGELV
jgi:hypothetical protein